MSHLRLFFARTVDCTTTSIFPPSFVLTLHGVASCTVHSLPCLGSVKIDIDMKFEGIEFIDINTPSPKFD